jgi:cell division protein FtsL
VPAARPKVRIRDAALPARRPIRAKAVDRLLRGRLWVACVGALLAGIVFLNVSLLQLNQEIARTTTHATALDRQNSELRARLATLDSSERIQRLAEARGMRMPAPGQYRYLRSKPWLDQELAARRATSPTPPAPVQLATPVAPATAATPVTTPAPTTTQSPTTTQAPATTTPATAQAAPTATTPPTATATP